jgi:hypothetical protein
MTTSMTLGIKLWQSQTAVKASAGAYVIVIPDGQRIQALTAQYSRTIVRKPLLRIRSQCPRLQERISALSIRHHEAQPFDKDIQEQSALRYRWQLVYSFTLTEAF